MKYLFFVSILVLILFMLFGCGAAKPEAEEADVSDASSDAVVDAEEEVVSDAEVEDAAVDTESSDQ